MEISEMPLSDRERDLISFVDTHSSSRIFRYKADDKLKSFIFLLRNLKMAKWSPWPGQADLLLRGQFIRPDGSGRDYCLLGWREILLPD